MFLILLRYKTFCLAYSSPSSYDWHACSVVQLCRILFSPLDCRLPGPSVHGILQARILEWVAMPSSRGIFLTQGSNLSLLHLLQCRRILYHWAIGEAFFMWPGEASNYSYPFSLTFFLYHYQSRVTMTQDWPIIISHLFGNSQSFKNRHTILAESIKIFP